MLRDPFSSYSLAKKEIEKIALTQSELETIAKKQFAIPRLALVKDIFLFSCCSGLAYIDVQNLVKENIITGIDGGKWLSSKREKTKNVFRVRLLQPAHEILEKYEKDALCQLKGCLLPMLTNQKMNAYLKEIAE